MDTKKLKAIEQKIAHLHGLVNSYQASFGKGLPGLARKCASDIISTATELHAEAQVEIVRTEGRAS